MVVHRSCEDKNMKRRYRINNSGEYGGQVVLRLKKHLMRMFLANEIRTEDFEFEVNPDYASKELKLRFFYKPKQKV